MDLKVAPVIKGVNKDKVESSVANYLSFHDDSKQQETDRTKDYATMINHYYDLATDFYEWGWGESFHFAPRHKQERFYASVARHEHYLALQMQLKKGMTVLDVGCGVGGPAREIARFSGVKVVGLNNNAYQIKRANSITKKAGLESQCSFVKGDFMKMPFEDNTFDAIYQIEATAHAPNKEACYKEILRVLKPGGVFGSYEWCLTDKYDANNAFHRKIKKGIEEGDGLPDIATCEEVNIALKAAGFKIEIAEDRVTETTGANDIPWYDPLLPKYSFSQNIQFTWIGRFAMNTMLKTLEYIGLVPKGTLEVQQFLLTAADSLREGGITSTFTPMYFTIATKPTA